VRLFYDSKTDSLYIDLNQRPGVDALEIVPGVVIDVDADGQVVGIDIQHASQVVDMERLETTEFPARRLSVS
jgi:uncharacterized protein YuzE